MVSLSRMGDNSNDSANLWPTGKIRAYARTHTPIPIMKHLPRAFLGSILILSPLTGFEVIDESLEMVIERLPIEYGTGDLIDLGVMISYRDNMKQKDYPDFIKLRGDLSDWSTSYNWIPEGGTVAVYWETMVKELCLRVLADYPNIEKVQLDAVVHPNVALNYSHIVTCKLIRSPTGEAHKAKESVAIPITRYAIEHQGPNVFDLKVRFHYIDNLGTRDYPDFEATYAQLLTLMEGYPVESDYWETMIKKISAQLLDDYPEYATIDMQMNVYPTASVDYYHQVNCSATR